MLLSSNQSGTILVPVSAFSKNRGVKIEITGTGHAFGCRCDARRPFSYGVMVLLTFTRGPLFPAGIRVSISPINHLATT